MDKWIHRNGEIFVILDILLITHTEDFAFVLEEGLL